MKCKKALPTLSREARTGHAILADDVLAIAALRSKRTSKPKISTDITSRVLPSINSIGRFNAKNMQRGREVFLMKHGSP